MRALRKLNVQESIRKKRLVFDEHWTDKFNMVAVIFVFGQLVFYPVLIIAFEKPQNINDRFFIYGVFPIAIFAGCFGIYRGLTEKRLIKIETSHDQQTIKQAILCYAEKNQLEVYRNSGNCIIINSPTTIMMESDHKKSRIFLFADGVLLFTVIRDDFKINLPVFFTHLFVKRDLAKLLRTNV